MNGRNPVYDHAKLVLIFLVVLGHLIEPYIVKSRMLEGVFNFIYLFHMPAFIFISGYFSKAELTVRTGLKLLGDYLVLFVFIQLVFVAVMKGIGMDQYQFLTFQPAYIYWYLFAMFAWSLILPAGLQLARFTKFGVGHIVVISVLIALIAGYVEQIGWMFSLSRILVFFPFFVLGYYFKSQNWTIYQAFPNRKMAVSVMMIVALMIWIWPNLFQFGLLSGANSYFKMGLDETGLILRLVLYMIQCLMIMAFFTLLPRKPFVFSHLGTKTLTIYILHGFLVKGLVAASYFDELTIGRVLFLPVLAVVLVMVLGRLPIRFQLSPYILKQTNREKKNKEKVS
ncbi:acyltransferase family protein [Exiguobacterium undae]|uniref:acyltransferase family protein n=1 Tax=Exiguobacterium undae TaxID=169177 RepID=UPI0009DD01DB|nr:acyltransferase family protein [Exiguobacterium undae]